MPLSLSEIAKQIEVAVSQRGAKLAAVKDAEDELKSAQADYQSTVDSIRNLNAQYQAAMKDILSYGGTAFVAAD